MCVCGGGGCVCVWGVSECVCVCVCVCLCTVPVCVYRDIDVSVLLLHAPPPPPVLTMVLEQSEYSVSEGEGVASVCAVLTGGRADFPIQARLQVAEQTATAGTHVSPHITVLGELWRWSRCVCLCSVCAVSDSTCMCENDIFKMCYFYPNLQLISATIIHVSNINIAINILS